MKSQPRYEIGRARSEYSRQKNIPRQSSVYVPPRRTYACARDFVRGQGIIRKKVFVAMSGGVDSSVAAALLKESGYNVTGIFMQVWKPDFLECSRTDDRREAMRAAAHLCIPFLTFDFEKEYKEKVVDYMIREYKAGRTPNPDVMCNKHIKFDLFLKKAREMGADYIATGHYVRAERESPKPKAQSPNKTQNSKQEKLKAISYKLKAGRDSAKDQSYFLWTLMQEQLQYCLFPVGEYAKPEVREMARKFGLPNAERRDSQGVCFIGQFPMKEFLKNYIPSQPGAVLNVAGEAIGTHDGARLYTLGERHGFLITKKSQNDVPQYVVAKDMRKNTITVASETMQNETTEATLTQVNFISSEAPKKGEVYNVRFRYRQPLVKAALFQIPNSKFQILFSAPQRAVTPGQSLVLYKGDECVGGGVIV